MIDAVDNKEPPERIEETSVTIIAARQHPSIPTCEVSFLATRLSVSSFGGPIGRWDYILMQRRQGPIIFANREPEASS